MIKKQKNIFIVLTILIILASTRLFYIVPLPVIFMQQPSNVLLVALVSLISFFIYSFSIKNKTKKVFKNEIIVLYIIIFLNIIYMHRTYGYTISQLLWSGLPYLIMLAYFPISDFVNKCGIDKLAYILALISLLLGIIALIQKFIYDLNGIVFLNVTLNSNFSGRFSGICDGMVRISVIVSLYELFLQKNHKILYLLNCIISIMAIFLVDQSRIYLLSVLISMIVMFIYKNKGRRKNGFTYVLYILLVVFGCIFLYQIFNSLITTLNNSVDGSNYARRGAIQYFFSQYSTHFWTGMGIIVPDEKSIYYSLITGPFGIYNYNDVGIFGLMASTGIFGVIWYLWVIVKSFFITHNSSYKLLNIGLLVEILISIFTMSYLEKGLLMALMLYLAIIGANNVKNKTRVYG